MITYTHEKADRGAPVARYVKYDEGGVYSFCECSVRSRYGWKYDDAQGTCSVEDLPPGVAMAAIAQRQAGCWPFYVEWPL